MEIDRCSGLKYLVGHEETYLKKGGWAEVGKRLEGWLIIQEHYFREPEFLAPRETTEKFNPRGPVLSFGFQRHCIHTVHRWTFRETPIYIKIKKAEE